MATKQTQTVERRPDFRVFSAPLEVKDVEGDDRPILHCTASSDAIDLEADRFTKSALVQMKDGFKGKVIFLNHSYRVPGDVFGLVTEASLVKRGGRLDLDMEIRVETGNPLAVQTYEYVANGTRLGISVGVIVTEHDKTEEEDAFGNRIVDISGIIPLEASVVGIPANQTAWTREAVKSLFERGAIDFDEEEIAARPWLNVAADKKEDTMSKDDTETDEKHTDGSEEEDSEGTDDNVDTDEDSDDNTDTDEDSGDVDEGSDDSASSEDEDSDGGSEEEETEDQEDEEGEHKEDAEEPDKADDFEDDVAADEAADMLISKMFTGVYVALDNLIPIVLDTDASVSDRAKAGSEVIEDWNKFVEKAWDEIMDHLDESKDVDTDMDFDLAVRLHDLAAQAETVECEVAELEEVTAKAEEVGEVAEAIAEENTQLREEIEKMAEELEYAISVYEKIMELPLPTVTKAAAEVARSLADRNPDIHTEVMERIEQCAPPRRN